MGQHRQALGLHPAYIGRGARIAFDRSGLIGLAADRRLGLGLYIRNGCFSRRFGPEAIEHASRLVAHLGCDLPREFREPDLAPLGERAGLVLLRPAIVGRHILRPLAPKRAGELLSLIHI